MNQGSSMTPVPLSYFRVPLVLLCIVAVVCIATVIDPPTGRLRWLLEVGPGLAGIFVLIVIFRRFPMSHMVYYCVFLHMFILIYGGYYTYAETPLGNWAKEVFGFSHRHTQKFTDNKTYLPGQLAQAKPLRLAEFGTVGPPR